MACRHIKAGERFVTQGEIEDYAYIIEKGSCLVIVEKDGELYPVDHYGQGYIVGGLGILTGEPRRAHVEAETDMEVWVLDRRDFENISGENPEFLKKFHNEAQTVATLNHKNIIRIYDIEERYRTVFIIMERVEGESLDLLIERLKTILYPLAVDYLMQICAGLAYAHNRGVIHRDINPTNIFVQPGDQLKILDFGLACPIGSEAVDYFGNLLYMAPEQVEGNAVDQRTDIYSVGVLAYEMVTGARPFQGPHSFVSGPWKTGHA